MSPVIRSYQAKAIIYFEGEKADSVYVLQTGTVQLKYRSYDATGDVQETIKQGEFFGVKSAMGGFNREETASVPVDTTVLCMTALEFEQLVLTNHKLVMKMLKVFSNQLRRLGKIIQSRMDDSTIVPDGSGIFNIGEYYLANKKFPQAVYSYKKYLQHYSSGEFAEICRERIGLAEKGVAPSPGKMRSSLAKTSAAAPKAETQDEPDSREPVDTVAALSEFKGEYDPYSAISVAKRYFVAYSLLSSEKFEEAYEEYKFIIDKSTSAGGEYIEKSYLDSGQCLLNLSKYTEAIQQLGRMLTKYPDTQCLKPALLIIGQSYLAIGDKEKAKSFLVKLKGTPPLDALNKKAEMELAKLGAGD